MIPYLFKEFLFNSDIVISDAQHNESILRLLISGART